MKKILGNSYLLGLFSGYFQTILIMLIGFVTTPFILKHITTAEYGVFALIQSTVGLLGLINFGFGGALGILVARNEDNIKFVNSCASITASLQLGIGIIAILFGIIASYNLEGWFGVIRSKENVSLTIVLSICFSITVVTQTYSNILIAYRKIHVDNLIKLFSNLLGIGLTIFFILNGFGILSLGYPILITQLITLYLAVFRLKKLNPEIKISYLYFNKDEFKELYKLGIWFFVGSISIIFIERFDNILTGKLINVEMVAILVLSSKLFEISKGLLYSITNNSRPYLAKMVSNGIKGDAYNFFRILRKVSILFSALASCFIIYINKYFVSIWVGEKFYGGDILTWCLAINLVFYCWKLPARAFLSSNMVVKEQSILGVFEGFINVLFSYFLGLKFGIIGIISGTFISGSIFYVLTYGTLFNHVKLENWSSFLTENLKILLQVTFFYAITYTYIEIFPVDIKIGIFPILLRILTFAILLFLPFYLINHKIFSEMRLIYKLSK